MRILERALGMAINCPLYMWLSQFSEIYPDSCVKYLNILFFKLMRLVKEVRMDKRAKTILAYAFLAVFLALSLIFLINFVSRRMFFRY